MDEIRLLEQDEQGNVCVRPAARSLLLMTGSEIYRVFFGVEGLYPTKAGEVLQQYGNISSNPHRTNAEDDKMQTLQKQLLDLGIEPDWEPVPREATE